MNIDGIEPVTAEVKKDVKKYPCNMVKDVATEHLNKLFNIVKLGHCPSVTTLNEIEEFLRKRGKIL